MYFIHRCFICRLLESTVSEDAGIEPRIVAVRRPYHSDVIHKVIAFSLVYFVFLKKFLME
jgi:hypothetical protein